MSTPAAQKFNTKRPSMVTYGLKPYHKPQSETLVQPSKKPRKINKNVLKCLNQAIKEPVVHLQKQDIPLPDGTIMIQLTTGGK